MPLSDKKYSKIGHRPDYFLIALVFVLTVFGLVMLASASSDLGKAQFNDSYYYIKHQIYNGLSVGLAGFFLGYFIYYGRWKKFALPLLIVGIIALALVFTKFGLSTRNAARWLKIGSVSFQPAEIMKPIFIIYLAAWLANSKLKRAVSFVEGLLPFMLVSGFVAVLLLLQPATSTVAILLGTGLVVYFLRGAELKYIFAVVLVAAAGFGAVIYLTPYRLARITGFLNQSGNAQSQNYQVNQALVAIGSGGLTGVGYGESASKAGSLPAPTDDSIFAVIAEELGFVGAGSVIAAFAALVLRLFWLAKRTRDDFGKLLLAGFGSVMALQSFTNMAAISGLIPLTGVPLPFISYGGTALAVFLTMSGIAANVSKYA